MSKKTLQNCYERQRRRLDCESVDEFPRGNARPNLQPASGLWISWNIDDIGRGAASIPTQQALGRVLPVALEEFFSPVDTGFAAITWFNRGHAVTDISTKIHPTRIVSELEMFMPVEYLAGILGVAQEASLKLDISA